MFYRIFVDHPGCTPHAILEGLPECIKHWEVARMPVEEIALVAASLITRGDGRLIRVCTAKETIKRIEKMVLKPVPVE